MAQDEIVFGQGPELSFFPFPSLLRDEIHVWHLSLDDLPRLERSATSVLNSDERHRAMRYVRREDSVRFAVCRGVLRLLLAKYLETAPSGLLFGYGPAGKPFLSSHHDRPIEFNVSHTGTEALLAFTWETPVGVDIEREQPQVDCFQIAQRFFSKWEEEQIRALSWEESVAAFYRLWTRKEAFIKATGRGLSFPLDAFDVDPTQTEQVTVRDVRQDGLIAREWQLSDLAHYVRRPDYAAALAYRGPCMRVRWFVYSSDFQDDFRKSWE